MNFIITSHGWSASNWLAYALNQHPDILCTHSARNIPASQKNMNSDHSLRHNLTRLQQGYVQRLTQAVDEKYTHIKSLGRARVYGSVHVLRLRDLPYLYKKFGSAHSQYVVMNLVRHPVALVWSGYGQFKSLFRYDLNELNWTLGKVLKDAHDFVNQLALNYDFFPGDLENLAFLGACAVLGSLKKDLDAEQVITSFPPYHYKGIVKMEDVTVFPSELKRVVQTVTSGALQADDDYLQTVYNLGVINEHKIDPNKRNAGQRYAQFKTWQKEAFRYFFKKYNLRESYERYGYDFSFLD